MKDVLNVQVEDSNQNRNLNEVGVDMFNLCMFDSKSNEWATPLNLFHELDNEFNFTLDPCANEYNYKCKKFFTEKENGLIQDWSNNIVFCNPPYGTQLKHWVKKCYYESLKSNTTIVMLIPSRTDTAYFHDFILNKSEIRFLRGRLKFNNHKNSAPFGSMIVVYKGDNNETI